MLRTRLTSHGVTGEPISLVLPDRPVKAVDALHFAEAETNAGSRWVAAMRDAAPRPPAPDQGLHRPAFSPLVELRGVLETLAERGTSGVDALATATTLARHHQALRGVGLLCFPELDPTTEDDPADLLIRSHYLLQQVELALP